MNVAWTSIIGFFLGFAFGVGCALAVMYSIFLGGYRAAIRDSALATPPARLIKARTKAFARDLAIAPPPSEPPASGPPPR